MSSIKDKLTEDMKTAMRAKDKDRLGAIRLALAAVKQREVDERIQLDDTQLLAILDKMIKQRRESVTQYRAGGREDLVAKEQFEIDVLQTYLPAALSEAELRQIIAAAIKETAAVSQPCDRKCKDVRTWAWSAKSSNNRYRADVSQHYGEQTLSAPTALWWTALWWTVPA
jgi:uncharacterized protein